MLFYSPTLVHYTPVLWFRMAIASYLDTILAQTMATRYLRMWQTMVVTSHIWFPALDEMLYCILLEDKGWPVSRPVSVSMHWCWWRRQLLQLLIIAFNWKLINMLHSWKLHTLPPRCLQGEAPQKCSMVHDPKWCSIVPNMWDYVFHVCRHYRRLWRCCEVAEWWQIAEHSTKLLISATTDKYYFAQEMLAILYQLFDGQDITLFYLLCFMDLARWKKPYRGRATITSPSSSTTISHHHLLTTTSNGVLHSLALPDLFPASAVVQRSAWGVGRVAQ